MLDLDGFTSMIVIPGALDDMHARDSRSQRAHVAELTQR
jgi:hypothetical protein